PQSESRSPSRETPPPRPRPHSSKRRAGMTSEVSHWSLVTSDYSYRTTSRCSSFAPELRVAFTRWTPDFSALTRQVRRLKGLDEPSSGGTFSSVLPPTSFRPGGRVNVTVMAERGSLT